MSLICSVKICSARVDEEEQEVVISNTDLVEEAKGVLRLFPVWATCQGRNNPQLSKNLSITVT